MGRDVAMLGNARHLNTFDKHRKRARCPGSSLKGLREIVVRTRMV